VFVLLKSSQDVDRYLRSLVFPDLGCLAKPFMESGDAQGICRDCVSLRELVGNWHLLTPHVREKIMGLVRG